MTGLLPTLERQTAREAISRFFVDRARPKVPLSTRDFAERYVRLPKTSPFGNVPFRCDRQPIVGLLFDEMDRGGWRTFLVSGPSQSGKTLSTFVIPVLRDVVELRLNTIIGFPEADMAADKWDTDFRPTFEASPDLRWLLPDKGPGSRGGRVRDRITLQNGVELKIMTRGGQDTGKAGFTSPRVRVTEAAGWSKRSEGSAEANPLRQLRARMKAFKHNDPRRCLFVEGTLTVPGELPWNGRGEDDDERFISSRSRILSPCPHCGEWISPGREHLVGWQQAASEDEAANKAAWLCPLCAAAISTEQRKAALADCRLVHGWQSIGSDGEVRDVPELMSVNDQGAHRRPTSTLWFHWQAWHNLLRDPADFAIAEWEAAQIEEGTQERENAEMELCQFDFSIPFKSTLTEQEPLDAKKIRGRKDEWARNIVPADTQKLVMGIDVGKWRMHWIVFALREGGQVHVIAYGTWDVCHTESDDESTRIVAAIDEINEQLVLPGFLVEGSGEYWIPDKVIIDENHKPDDVAAGLRAIGQRGWKARWIAAHGVGRSTDRNKSGYRQKTQRSMQYPWLGVQWHAGPNLDRRIVEIAFNADYWKLWLQDRLRANPGRKGALTIYAAQNPNEHGKLSNHWVSEQMNRRFDPKKGWVEDWTKSGQNHWLDAGAMAGVGADTLGWRLREIDNDPLEEAEEGVVDEQVAESATCEPAVNWYARMLQNA